MNKKIVFVGVSCTTDTLMVSWLNFVQAVCLFVDMVLS